MKLLCATAAAITALALPMLVSATETDRRLDAAADLLTDMMQSSDKGVPQDLLNRSQCVILVPGLKKGGFGIGGKYGRGFAMCRRAGGTGWSAPAGMRIEGGSVGFQIGVSEQDVMLLVMRETGMKRLLADKFTLGGEATAAAGPVGRDATAQTDVLMRAEMLSYSRARGLFAGISLNGATMRPDKDANQEMYGAGATNQQILTGNTKSPAGAAKMEGLLNKNSSRQTK